jgi:NADH:ubiquinone oxidoreductase subunit E
MSMTDTEAGLWLNFRRREACDRILAGDVTAENDIAGYDHALQAIEDRAALVEELERAQPRQGWLPAYAESCRRHMKGEE